MSNPDSAAPFADNWAYLKTELAWLDRVLMLAVAKQRQDLKEINRVARTAGDRATSHWWKGIVAIQPKAAYDNHQPPTALKKVSYSQQMEARIRTSQAQGIVLGLPWLRDALHLTPFEKNLILLTLAPEVNRRFGRLYSYLQYQEDAADWDLPTVDLCLRLFCRNDQEWRRARAQLVKAGSLLERGILEWVDAEETTLLSRHLRLADDITAYLLAEQPNPDQLSHWTTTAPPSAPDAEAPEAPSETTWQPQATLAFPWKQLVLPNPLLDQLETLAQVATRSDMPGQIILLEGDPGTGKSTVAYALASRLESPLAWIDLATIPAATADAMLADLYQDDAAVFLLKSAQQWFGRQSTVDTASLRHWVQQRRSQPGLTLLSVRHAQSIKPSWRQQMDAILRLPRPDAAARRQLLRHALPADIKADRKLRWSQVAQQLPLTGGELTTLVQTAAALAQQAGSDLLTLEQLQQALAVRHPHLMLKARVQKADSSPPQ